MIIVWNCTEIQSRVRTNHIADIHDIFFQLPDLSAAEDIGFSIPAFFSQQHQRFCSIPAEKIIPPLFTLGQLRNLSGLDLVNGRHNQALRTVIRSIDAQKPDPYMLHTQLMRMLTGHQAGCQFSDAVSHFRMHRRVRLQDALHVSVLRL